MKRRVRQFLALALPALLLSGSTLTAAGVTVAELFGKELRNSAGETVATEQLEGKIVGIYFSAHWCPPCRAFTPKLVELHKELTAAGKEFEIVFVSGDRSEAAMYDYMRETSMPWLAVPFGAPEAAALNKRYQVRGIPSLIIIDSSGKTVTAQARGDVMTKGAAAFDSWSKK